MHIRDISINYPSNPASVENENASEHTRANHHHHHHHDKTIVDVSSICWKSKSVVSLKHCSFRSSPKASFVK